MEQSIDTDGIGIQIDGNNNTVTVLAGAARLTIEQRHLAQRTPETERDLLLTDFRATRLVGRQTDLAALETWLASPRLISVRCLVARAGAGKTRIGIELCERANRSGWLAGFCTLDELQRFSAQQSLADWRWQDKTLIVVDYAAAGAVELRKWLSSLVQQHPRQSSLRLLLLERHADQQFGWWAELTRPGGLSTRGLDAILDPVAPVTLSSLRETHDRRTLLEEVINEGARIRGVISPYFPPFGDDRTFDEKISIISPSTEPLYLIMAGITALDTGIPEALSLGNSELAFRIAGAELNRVKRLAQLRSLDENFCHHLSVCLTLQGGCLTNKLYNLIREETPSFGSVGTNTDQWASLLFSAFANQRPKIVGAVEPDLIAEAFILNYFVSSFMPEDEKLLTIKRCRNRGTISVYTTLMRMSMDFANGDPDHSSVNIFYQAVMNISKFGDNSVIHGHIPASTVVLRGVALHLSLKEVQFLKRLGTYINESSSSYPKPVLELLAPALGTNALRLSEVNALEAACKVSVEAVDAFRALTNFEPHPHSFNLASALLMLSTRMMQLGYYEDSIDKIEEAISIIRSLDPSVYNELEASLAAALGTFSNCLILTGKRDKALSTLEEAINIERSLVQIDADRHSSVLAGCLHNYGHCLNLIDRSRLAADAFNEALSIRRRLAAVWPDQFKTELADTLIDFSISLSILDQPKKAAKSCQEALTYYRHLSKLNPELFDQRLATCLNNMSNHLQQLGFQYAALWKAQESITIRRKLVSQAEGVFLPELASALNNASRASMNVRQYKDAMSYSSEAIKIRRELVDCYPDTFLPYLSRSLQLHASIQMQVDNSSLAIDAIAEAISAIYLPMKQSPLAFSRLTRSLIEDYEKITEREKRMTDADIIAELKLLVRSVDTLETQGGSEL